MQVKRHCTAVQSFSWSVNLVGLDRILVWLATGQAIAVISKALEVRPAVQEVFSEAGEVWEFECEEWEPLPHPFTDSACDGLVLDNIEIPDLLPTRFSSESWPEPLKEFWGCPPSPSQPKAPYPEVVVDIFFTDEESVCVILMVTESPWASAMLMEGLVKMEKARDMRVGRKREICAWRSPALPSVYSKESASYYDAVEVDLWACSDSETSEPAPCPSTFCDSLVRQSLSMTTLMGERKGSMRLSGPAPHATSAHIKLTTRFRKLRDIDSAKEEGSIKTKKKRFDFEPIMNTRESNYSDFFCRIRPYSLRSSRTHQKCFDLRRLFKRSPNRSDFFDIENVFGRIKSKIFCCGVGEWSDNEE